jgi:hypothetical protein
MLQLLNIPNQNLIHLQAHINNQLLQLLNKEIQILPFIAKDAYNITEFLHDLVIASGEYAAKGADSFRVHLELESQLLFVVKRLFHNVVKQRHQVLKILLVAD